MMGFVSALMMCGLLFGIMVGIGVVLFVGLGLWFLSGGYEMWKEEKEEENKNA